MLYQHLLASVPTTPVTGEHFWIGGVQNANTTPAARRYSISSGLLTHVASAIPIETIFCIAEADSGEFYTGGVSNGVIQRYSSSGTLINTFATNYGSQILNINFDEINNLIYVGGAGTAFKVYTMDGVLVKTLPVQSGGTQALAISPNFAAGYFYTNGALSNNCRIEKKDLNGNLLLAFTPTTGNNLASRVVVENRFNNEVYICPSNTKLVWVYTSTGSFRKSFSVLQPVVDLLVDSSSLYTLEYTFGQTAYLTKRDFEGVQIWQANLGAYSGGSSNAALKVFKILDGNLMVVMNGNSNGTAKQFIRINSADGSQILTPTFAIYPNFIYGVGYKSN